jgi:hypothetical protein
MFSWFETKILDVVTAKLPTYLGQDVEFLYCNILSLYMTQALSPLRIRTLRLIRIETLSLFRIRKVSSPRNGLFCEPTKEILISFVWGQNSPKLLVNIRLTISGENNVAVSAGARLGVAQKVVDFL